MVNTTQATMRHTIGHVVLLEHQYHSAAVILEDTVAHIDMVFVINIVIGAEAQHRLVLSAILLLKVQL